MKKKIKSKNIKVKKKGIPVLRYIIKNDVVIFCRV